MENLDFDLEQFRALFVDEAQQHLQTLNAQLLALERDPADSAALQTVFRAAHSLKGSAATMGYEDLAALAHEAENVLDHLRRGEWQWSAVLVETLFAVLDSLQILVADVAAERPPSIDVPAAIAHLRQSPLDETISAEESAPSLAPLTAESPAGADAAGTAPQPLPAAPSIEAPLQPLPQTNVIRVDVRHLDALLDIVTEMVIHRSLLTRLNRRFKLPALAEALQLHDRHLSQLRDAVLDMRMVPVEQVFERFPRMVRDLLKAQNKEAQLLLEGVGVEMDRTALEALHDPLVHLLRNAIDHGLETPAEREAIDKPARGTLRLSAHRERDSVVIELSDDGRGMIPAKIAAAAIERGVATAEQVAGLSEQQILHLVCSPNFSMSREVTAVSGRGVGMSVVKREVEALRGSLEIETRPHQGTTFRLRLPLMLALVDAMLVQVGPEQYALPITQVQRIIELDSAQVEQLGARRLLMLQDDVLPLLDLAALLQLPDGSSQPRYVLLVRREGQAVGVQVDAVLGYEEIVVKPLPAALRGLPGLSGATILGEGQTILILDLQELI